MKLASLLRLAAITVAAVASLTSSVGAARADKPVKIGNQFGIGRGPAK
jgi:hypothetical protein